MIHLRGPISLVNSAVAKEERKIALLASLISKYHPL